MHASLCYNSASHFLYPAHIIWTSCLCPCYHAITFYSLLHLLSYFTLPRKLLSSDDLILNKYHAHFMPQRVTVALAMVDPINFSFHWGHGSPDVHGHIISAGLFSPSLSIPPSNLPNAHQGSSQLWGEKQGWDLRVQPFPVMGRRRERQSGRERPQSHHPITCILHT